MGFGRLHANHVPVIVKTNNIAIVAETVNDSYHFRGVPQHLSLVAPSSVSNSVKDGGTFCGPQFFTFSSAKSHENCLHFKVAPVINDKKHPKHLVVTGALHAIQ